MWVFVCEFQAPMFVGYQSCWSYSPPPLYFSIWNLVHRHKKIIMFPTDVLHKVNDCKKTFKDRYTLLTPREKEIIGLWLNGLKSAEMAEELNITKSTVLTHKKNVLRKTQLKSPKDAVLFALAFGII